MPLVSVKNGPMLIADISGYARFVHDTEIEHSREILSELLETVVRAVGGKLEVTQLAGDAIFFIGAVPPEEIVRIVEKTFIRFHQRIRAMRAATNCPCNACRSIGNLNLKFVVHTGSYSFQRVGPAQQVYGTDVNLAHRLLKNQLGSHEYLLASTAFLDALTNDLRAEFHPHSETYDIGVVECGYLDLGPRWLAAQEAEVTHVTAAASKHSVEAHIDAPIERVWHVLLDAELRQQWMGAPALDVEAGARGSLADTQYHCHHGPNAKTVYRVVSARPPYELNEECEGGLGTLFETRVLESEGPDRTLFTNRMHWDDSMAESLNQEQRDQMGFLLGMMDICYRDRLGAVARGETVGPLPGFP